MSTIINGKTRFISGDHNVICDRTGQKAKRSDCRYEWTGMLVRKDVWEEKHPQLDLRGRRDDIAVEGTRPRQPTNFVVQPIVSAILIDGGYLATEDNTAIVQKNAFN